MIKMILLLIALILSGCASGGSSGESGLFENQLEDKLVNFKIEVQAGRYDEAVNMISLDERSQLYDGPSLKDESIRGMKLLNLSTLQRNSISLDSDDNIIGLVNAIQMAYMRSQVSEEQRKALIPPAPQEPSPAVKTPDATQVLTPQSPASESDVQSDQVEDAELAEETTDENNFGSESEE